MIDQKRSIDLVDHVLESLHSHKHYFTETWVYDHLLAFIGSFMQNFNYYNPESVGLIFEKFSSFVEMCMDSVIQRILAVHAEKECICKKALRKRKKHLNSEMHLPMLFLTDLVWSITDAKNMATHLKNR
jgi:hypothetical protein